MELLGVGKFNNRSPTENIEKCWQVLAFFCWSFVLVIIYSRWQIMFNLLSKDEIILFILATTMGPIVHIVRHQMVRSVSPIHFPIGKHFSLQTEPQLISLDPVL